MPFTFKLSQRLARMRVPALLVSTAVLAACEHPSRISGLGQGATLVVVPNAVTLAPLQSQQFAAFGRTNAGDSVPTAVTWNTNMGSITGSGRCRRRWCDRDRKSTRLNSSHGYISYAVFCLKKKITQIKD